MSANRRNLYLLLTAVPCVFVVYWAVGAVSRYMAGSFPLWLRLPMLLALQWAPALLVAKWLAMGDETVFDLGLTFARAGRQILLGAALAAGMLLVFFILPTLCGLTPATTTYADVWVFLWHAVYMVFSVGIVEELVFRGYLFRRLALLFRRRWAAVVLSSLLFGLLHLLNGSWAQVLGTTLIGLFLCLAREWIPGCTLGSLMAAHGIYNALLPVLVKFF